MYRILWSSCALLLSRVGPWGVARFRMSPDLCGKALADGRKVRGVRGFVHELVMLHVIESIPKW